MSLIESNNTIHIDPWKSGLIQWIIYAIVLLMSSGYLWKIRPLRRRLKWLSTLLSDWHEGMQNLQVQTQQQITAPAKKLTAAVGIRSVTKRVVWWISANPNDCILEDARSRRATSGFLKSGLALYIGIFARILGWVIWLVWKNQLYAQTLLFIAMGFESTHNRQLAMTDNLKRLLLLVSQLGHLLVIISNSEENVPISELLAGLVISYAINKLMQNDQKGDFAIVVQNRDGKVKVVGFAKGVFHDRYVYTEASWGIMPVVLTVDSDDIGMDQPLELTNWCGAIIAGGRLGDVVIVFENEQYFFMERGTENVDPNRQILRTWCFDGVKISGAPLVVDGNKENTFQSSNQNNTNNNKNNTNNNVNNNQELSSEDESEEHSDSQKYGSDNMV